MLLGKRRAQPAATASFRWTRSMMAWQRWLPGLHRAATSSMMSMVDEGVCPLAGPRLINPTTSTLSVSY